MHEANVTNSDIKALLMLLLLKGGTRADEIQTALQMAAVSRLMGLDETLTSAPQPPSPATHSAKMSPPLSESFAAAETHFGEHSSRTAMAAMNRRPLTPKQILRNEYLAPIKGYAA